MSQSIYNNNKTPSWSDTQNRSSANNTSVCDLCQGFSCVSCMLNPNHASKKRKYSDNFTQPSQNQTFQNDNNNNQNNNRLDINSPPAHNTRSALKRSNPDNTSALSQSQSTISASPTISRSNSNTLTSQIALQGLSDLTSTSNQPKPKMNVKNLIDLREDEPLKVQNQAQPTEGASSAKGLLCPVCQNLIPTATTEASLNLHIDECLSMKLLEEENTVPKNAPIQQQPLANAFNFAMPQDPNLQMLFGMQQLQQQMQPIKPPKQSIAKKEPNYVKHHDDDDEHWEDEDEEEYYERYQEEEESLEEQLVEQLGKVRCPYGDCGGFVAMEEFGKHVLQNHKGGHQKLLCPLCAPQTGYSLHKGTNLFRHVQQYHAFLAASPEPTTNKPHAKPDSKPKPQNIEFVEEVLLKDLDNECCICFEQFETGNTVARLPCLCIFHKTCVVRWFEKEKRCPVHEEIPQS